MTSHKSTISKSDSDPPRPPPFQYEHIEGAERLEKYRPGGYHPILIGDILRARYRVVHKLGYGTYSITWLCRDNQSARYVAVKVGTAESNPGEGSILKFLRSPCPALLDHEGAGMMPSVTDRFVLHGPNGSHPCYVSSPARCSLSGAKDGSYKRLFPATTARSLIVQLVLAVEYVHARGYVHGDIHLGNILLGLPGNFDKLSIEQLYGKYGVPASDPVVRLDGQPLEAGVPSTMSPPVWLGKASEEFSPSETKILLTDFGEAYSPPTESRHYSNSPISFVPPEAIFEPERGLSFPSDIWNLACAAWAILGQRHLFEDILATQDDITAEQVDVLGKLPPKWWGKWEARHEYFDEMGKPNHGRHFRSWESRFDKHIQQSREEAGTPGFDAEEKAAVMDMLRSMLSYAPEKRLTARSVLECEWMVKWALPEFAKYHSGSTRTRS